MKINLFQKINLGLKHRYLRKLAKNQKHFQKLLEFKTSDTCVLIGAGPSLDKSPDLEAALEKFDSFGCNHVWRNKRISKHKFTYYALVDREYTKTSAREIVANARSQNFCFAFKNGILLPIVELRRNDFFVFKTNNFNQDFKTSKLVNRDIIYTGNVMPFMIQIAMLLGYRKIILFGLDHYKNIPKDFEARYFDGYQKSENYRPVTEERIQLLSHFHSWLEDQSEILGNKIFNLTPNTYLEFYERNRTIAEIEKLP